MFRDSFVTNGCELTIMFYPGRSRVNNSEVVSSGASIICGCSVVPNDDNLFRRFKVANCANVTFAAVLKIRQMSLKSLAFLADWFHDMNHKERNCSTLRARKNWVTVRWRTSSRSQWLCSSRLVLTFDYNDVLRSLYWKKYIPVSNRNFRCIESF